MRRVGGSGRETVEHLNWGQAQVRRWRLAKVHDLLFDFLVVDAVVLLEDFLDPFDSAFSESVRLLEVCT